MISTPHPLNWVNTWISKNYCRNWKLHEGLREHICNQYDGICKYIHKENVFIEKLPNKTDFIFRKGEGGDIYGEIKYDKETQTLTIWNKGKLVTANLLLGGTKDIENSAEIIGRFGEGMKLSALALLRENKERNKIDNETQLNIYTEGKVWRFIIKEADGFEDGNNKPQLCLHWRSEVFNKEEYEGKVICEIIGISEDEWINELDNYLWLTHRETGTIEVFDEKESNKKIGEVLCDNFFRNKIYVKEVFINDTGTERDMTSYFGFNLDISLDRDRNSVKNLSERNKAISKILSIILNKLDDYKKSFNGMLYWLDIFPEEIYKLLSKGYNLVYYFNANNLTQQACDKIYKIWTKENGNVFPCCYDEVHILDILRKYRLPNSFYPYAKKANWLTDPVLKKSKYYKSIDDKFKDELNSKENITPDVLHENALKEIVEKVKRVKGDFTRDKIIFKNFDRTFYELHYNDNGKVILPSIFLNESIDKKWKCKVCGKILDAYEIKSSQIIEIFNIF